MTFSHRFTHNFVEFRRDRRFHTFLRVGWGGFPKPKCTSKVYFPLTDTRPQKKVLLAPNRSSNVYPGLLHTRSRSHFFKFKFKFKLQRLLLQNGNLTVTQKRQAQGSKLITNCKVSHLSECEQVLRL